MIRSFGKLIRMPERRGEKEEERGREKRTEAETDNETLVTDTDRNRQGMTKRSTGAETDTNADRG